MSKQLGIRKVQCWMGRHKAAVFEFSKSSTPSLHFPDRERVLTATVPASLEFSRTLCPPSGAPGPRRRVVVARLTLDLGPRVSRGVCVSTARESPVAFAAHVVVPQPPRCLFNISTDGRNLIRIRPTHFMPAVLRTFAASKS